MDPTLAAKYEEELQVSITFPAQRQFRAINLAGLQLSVKLFILSPTLRLHHKQHSQMKKMTSNLLPESPSPLPPGCGQTLLEFCPFTVKSLSRFFIFEFFVCFKNKKTWWKKLF